MSTRRASNWARFCVLFVAYALLAACGAPSTPDAGRGAPQAAAKPAVVALPDLVEGSAAAADNEQLRSRGVDIEGASAGDGTQAEPGTAVPVTTADPTWGAALAPVTLVVWGDFECPFTSRFMATLERLEKRYGPERLRVVWKHNPLPFHKTAFPAHLAAETVFRLKSADAFWRFHKQAFANQRDLTPDNFVTWASEAGVPKAAFLAAYEAHKFAAKIDEDMTAGKTAGVTGTPASFINGVFMSGAQPIEKAQQIIDEQLAAAAALRAEGAPRERIYAILSQKNKVAVPARQASPPPDSTTVWKVPIDGSPVRGGSAALVTLVMFGDFQCPFCGKVVPTVEGLLAKYGDKLRLVFKQHPLSFHQRAEPAAELALEARTEKGDDGFWKAWKLLFDNQKNLEEADLLGYAASLGLNASRVKRAITTKLYSVVIDRDQALAEELEGTGTPHFFINGRRLVGAQPSSAFEAIIDEEIKRAQMILGSGVRPEKLYETLQKDARSGPPPERIMVPAPTSENPAKGAKPGAKVTVQMFADLECPFTRHLQPVVDELIAAFPGKVRVVWRHRPLPMHKNAPMASEAAVEAFRQKGDAGFWAMTKNIFEAQPGGLSREAIEQSGAAINLDMAKLRAALDSGAHKAVIQADVDLADRLFITGTPMLAINDYFVGGAWPLARLKRLVERALGPYEAPAPGSIHKAPSPSPSPSPAASGPLFGAKHLLIMYVGSRRAPAAVTRTRDEARALAEALAKKARAGADFAGLVVQYSDEPGAAGRGGDLGKFPAGAMVPEFQQALEHIKVGEISGVVETPFGFHVILRTQ